MNSVPEVGCRAVDWRSMRHLQVYYRPSFPGQQSSCRGGLDGSSKPGRRSAVGPSSWRTAHGAIDAWDPLTGKKKWSVQDKYPRISGILSTKGSLVFSADMKGYIYAYDADTGKELWKFNMGSGSRGGIISYMAGGEQYVLVPSGLGSAAQGVTAQVFPEVAEFPAGGTLFAFKVPK